jgi:hypothetical protein
MIDPNWWEDWQKLTDATNQRLRERIAALPEGLKAKREAAIALSDSKTALYVSR